MSAQVSTTTVNSIKVRTTKLKLNKVAYKGFTLGSLPKRFAFIYDESEDREGITEWFNYKGLTWIRESDLKTGW